MVMPINEVGLWARHRTIQQTQTWATQATANFNLFTIANGAIYVVMFIGWCQTALTSVGATTIYHRFTPENLAAGIEDLNTILTVTNDPIDTIYTCTGAIAVILAEEDNGLCLTPSFGTNHWILGPGVVRLVMTAATSVTGTLVTTMIYQPLNSLVTVVAE